MMYGHGPHDLNPKPSQRFPPSSSGPSTMEKMYCMVMSSAEMRTTPPAKVTKRRKSFVEQN